MFVILILALAAFALGYQIGKARQATKYLRDDWAHIRKVQYTTEVRF